MRFQGLGYSKLALNQIRKLLESDYKDCAAIQLFVEDDNIPAKNLYQGFGFCIVNKYDDGLIHMAYTLKNSVELKLISIDCLDDD